MPNEIIALPSQPIALITGGSRGLGRSTALALAERGTDVIITYNTNAGEADKVVAAIRAMGRKAQALQLDAGNVASFPAFADALRATLTSTWGSDTFHRLVNNAGSYRPAPIGQITEADFDYLCNLHFKGVLFLTQALLPLLADGGRIVNLSTGMTRFTGYGAATYSAMKGAVEVLTVFMAKELAARRITVNSVAPGAIETDFGGGFVRDDKQVNDYVVAATALGRTGRPDDIGPMIASLLSDANAWVTAQRIEVSGGMFL